MKKALSLIIIGVLCFSTFSMLSPQVEAQECVEPEILASDLDEPEGILVHDGFVYWVERQHFSGHGGRIGKAPVDGGLATTFADIREPTNVIVSDGTCIYVASSLSGCYVKKIRISDGLTTDLVPPPTGPWTNYPFSVALLGDRVYWSSSTHAGVTGGVWSIPKDGGSIQELARLHYHLVIDTSPGDNWIYIVEIHEGDVMRVPVGGGAVEMLYDSPKLADMTAGFPDVASGYVYWPATAEGKICSIPASGGPREVLAEGENNPYSVLVDGDYAYWAADTSISRVPIDGSGPVELLVDCLVGPKFLAISNGYLYWSEFGWLGPSPGHPGGPPDPNIGTIKRTALPKREIEATVDIDPDTLNLKSNGEWITAYIELPEEYSVSEIDVSSIVLNGTISVDIAAPTQLGDYDVDGILDLMVKFERAAVIEWLGTVDYGEDTGKTVEVTLAITGEAAGTRFEGVDTIRVLLKG